MTTPIYKPGDLVMLKLGAPYLQQFHGKPYAVENILIEDSSGITKLHTYQLEGFPFGVYEYEIQPTDIQPTPSKPRRRDPTKPEPCRNFWIEAEIDTPRGKQILAGGPASKDGGFSLKIKIRNQGEYREVMTIAGVATNNTNWDDLTLTAIDENGDVCAEYVCMRDKPTITRKKANKS